MPRKKMPNAATNYTVERVPIEEIVYWREDKKGLALVVRRHPDGRVEHIRRGSRHNA